MHCVLLLALLAMGGVNAWGDTYTWTLAKGDISSTSTTSVTKSSVTWTISGTMGYYGWDGNTPTAAKMGSKNSKASDLVFSTTGISGTIASVKINAKTDSNDGTIAVSVGGTNYSNNGSTDAVSLTKSYTSYSFTGTSSGEIDITFNSVIYLNSITITYSSGPTDPTFNISPETIDVNGTATITYPEELTDIVFTSSNESVATVTDNGSGTATVTGKKGGNVTITATWGATDNYNASATGGSTVGSVIVNSSVAMPTITPATGTYTEAQTVEITAVTGATIYYTTNGNDPTTSSSVYSGTFTVKNTTTVKAIAVIDGESSNVATSVISIDANVTIPTINDQSDDHKVTITIPDGTTVYYTTDGTSPLNSDGTLSGSVHTYTAGQEITLTKATTIQAVAMDADGNFSKVVSKNFAYNGEVTVPYYEEFLTELGNFTVESTATNESYNSPVWEIHKNEATSDWGEREYAWATGWDISNKKALIGNTRLISPVIDLTDGGKNDYTSAYFYFIHKCGYFSSSNLETKCTVWVKESTSSEWTQISASNITWPTDFKSNNFTKTNSGQITLTSYVNKKIQISFLFQNSNTSSNTGTWNLDYIYVDATKSNESATTETVTTNGGLVTYVTKHKVNWVATRDNGKSTTTDDEGNTTTKYNVRGFKVTEFDANTVVLVEFGTGASGSEQYTPQNTPIVLKGATDDQSKHEVYLTVYDTDETIAAPTGNLLRASYNDVTAQDGERLFVMQKINGTYGWHKLATGRTVPDRKAYLNGIDEKTQVSSTESDPLQGKYVSFDDIEDSSTVTGITDVNNEQPRVNDGVFYNLQGMRVENPTHGIYIVNGKKVIIK